MNSNASCPDWKAERPRKSGNASEWLEQSLGERGRPVSRIGRYRSASFTRPRTRMIGGVALERAERELERVQEQHERAERELDSHRLEAGYRRGLEWAFHALGDLNRDKRLSTRERQAALELESARGRCEQLERWLKEPAQQRLIGERVGELRQRDQRLLRELQQERDELGRGARDAPRTDSLSRAAART